MTEHHKTKVNIELTDEQKEWSALQYQIWLESLDNILILVIGFEGAYGYGSAGNSDAAFMNAVDEAAHKSHPEAVATIYDFRKLSYEWGDAIEWVIGGYLAPIVVSELNIKGLTTLAKDWGAELGEWLFESLDAARAYLEQGFREQHFIKHYSVGTWVEIYLEAEQISKIQHYRENKLWFEECFLSDRVKRKIYDKNGDLEKEVETKKQV